MRRGEVWWAEFDERRPVVLLSGEDPSGFQAMQVVAPADTDISGLGIEVAVGVQEGLSFDGVLRFVFPRPGFTPCTWLTTLSREDLIERAGAVSAAKLSEIDDALRASEQRAEWTPAAAAKLSEIWGPFAIVSPHSRARSPSRVDNKTTPGDGRFDMTEDMTEDLTEEEQRALLMKLAAQPSKEDAEARAVLEAIHDPRLDDLRASVKHIPTSNLIRALKGQWFFEMLLGKPKTKQRWQAGMLAVSDEIDRRIPIPK